SCEMALQKYSVSQEKNDLTMSVSMKNLTKNDQQGASQKAVAQNGEVAGSGGIWPDAGSSDGSESASDAGE
nr:hypothetical protein [Tanacetum cinerariifolium]